MNILVFSYYKEYQHELSLLNSDFEFVSADLNNDENLVKQVESANICLSIFSVKNLDMGVSMFGNSMLLKGAMTSLLNSRKSIIFIKTREANQVMSLFNFRLCMSVINDLVRLGGFAILNDNEKLNELIVKLKDRNDSVLKHDSLIKEDNINLYRNFISDKFPDDYVEGKCLLSQSVYIINGLLNERSLIKG